MVPLDQTCASWRGRRNPEPLVDDDFIRTSMTVWCAAYRIDCPTNWNFSFLQSSTLLVTSPSHTMDVPWR